MSIFDFPRFVQKKVQKILNFVLLHIIFVFGIGLPSLVAKVLGKQFLPSKPLKPSTWIAHSSSQNIERMY
jgi:hypothetical protein